jgi:ABC-type branched-subunit amino acid transport system substrate-binding protein
MMSVSSEIRMPGFDGAPSPWRWLLAGALALACTATTAEIVVGSVVPQRGPAAASGLEFLQGTRAYFQALNRHGGVNGQSVRLVVGDDGGDAGSEPDRTVSEFKRLLRDESPVAFVNASGTPNIEALLKDGSVVNAGVPVVGPFSLSNALRTRGVPNLVFVRTGALEEARRMVGQSLGMGITRIAVVYAENSFGKEFHELARRSITAHAALQARSIAIDPKATDMRAAVAAMLEHRAQLSMLLVPGRMVPALVKAYREAGGGGFLVASSAASAELIVRSVGPELARGVGLIQVVPPVVRKDIPLVREFNEALAAMSANALPSAYALEGYINAKILTEGLRRSKSLSPEATTQALRGISGWDIGGLRVDLADPRRSGLSYADLGVIGRDGRLKR